jgi:phosphate butyryltransferase (EC 2.3.1.19)
MRRRFRGNGSGRNARKAGVAEAFLVGNSDKIKEVADKLGIDLANYEVVDEKGGEAACST